MIQRFVATDYSLPDLYEPKRWMCSKCGLIFDYLHSPDEAGWPHFDPLLEVMDMIFTEDGEQVFAEPDRREICPRCSSNLEETPLIPIVVSTFTFTPFAKETFMVEDSAHKIVIESIAHELGKDIDVISLGNSDNVKKFFEEFKKKNLLNKGFFLIDGDNKTKIYPDEAKFIHLDKYCIENYLLDPEICSVIVSKSVEEINQLILDDIKSTLIQINNVFAVFNNILNAEHIHTALSNLDGSKILRKLLPRLNIEFNDYAEKYVQECKRQEKLDVVFYKKLVDSVKNIN